MRFFKYFSIAILFLAGVLVWQNSQSDYQQLRGYIFGTYYSIKIHTNKPISDFAQIIEQQFDLVNQQMSVFTKDSIINKLNQAKENEWIATPAELHRVLKTSEEIYKQSDGAFDPTIGKLVRLWGFGPDGRRNTPSAEQIKEVMTTVGFDKVMIKEQEAAKQKALTEINLSAIAKGYAVDLIAEKIKSLGHTDFLVDIGGEIYASGNKNDRTQGWTVGIAEPSENGNKNLMTIGLKDMAVATSGNYNNFYYVDGKKIAHTINPQNGYPVEHNLVSATVFNQSCMKADAYATAIMSMGEEKGLSFANKYKLSAILFIKDINGNISVLFSRQAKLLIGE